MSEVIEFARILRRMAWGSGWQNVEAWMLDAAIAEYESRGRESGAGGTVAPSEGCAPRTPPERVAPAPSLEELQAEVKRLRKMEAKVREILAQGGPVMDAADVAEEILAAGDKP